MTLSRTATVFLLIVVSWPRPAAAGEGRRFVLSDGVTVTLESRPNALAYRFDVTPGADPASIRMRYKDASDVRAEDGGRSLRVRVGDRTVRETGLFCFQEDSHARRSPVDCSYDVRKIWDGFEVALRIGPYDRTRALVIDPEIGWSTYLGGSSTESGGGIAVDGAGNVYVTGDTCSTDFPTEGGFDTTYGGEFCDAFVAKVNADGSSLAWSSYLGGPGVDHGRGVAVDASGSAYLAGLTSSDDLATAGAFDPTLDGFSDAFVTKVSPDGSSLEWSSYLGGSESDQAAAIAVDESGNVYVTGMTASQDFPTPGGFDTTCDAGCAFVTKVGADGSSLVWSSCLGAVSRGYGIAVDGSENVYLTGLTSTSDFPTPGAFDSTYDGSIDAFVTKVNANGSNLAWSSFLGGAGQDEGRGIAVDGLGNAYVTGYTFSTDFPTTGGFDTELDGFRDAFVTKVNADGASLAWSSYLGGSADNDYGRGIAVDGSGNAYVAGSTTSTDFPMLEAFDSELAGVYDGFVTKVLSDGSGLAWSSYLGGSGFLQEWCYGIAVDAAGNTYVTGQTQSPDFPTQGGFDTSLPGVCYDDVPPGCGAFVTRIDACGDGVCAPWEDSCTCPEDCGPNPCGDGQCCGGETCESCAADCGTCPDGGGDEAVDGSVVETAAGADGSAGTADAGGDGAGVPSMNGFSSCACHLGWRASGGPWGLCLLWALLVGRGIGRRTGAIFTSRK